MQTIIILGAGQFGKAVSDLIDPNQFKLQAFGDNSPFLWNTEIQTAFGKVPVVSIEQAAAFKPDLILIAVSDAARSQMLMDQVKTAGYGKKCMLLHELYRTFDIRSATLHRMAKRVSEGNIPGDIAELGVYRGNIAWQLNALFPDRQLLLFDTFEGFSRKDIQIEKMDSILKYQKKRFLILRWNTSAIVCPFLKMPYFIQDIFRKQQRIFQRGLLPLSAWMLTCMRRSGLVLNIFIPD